MKARRTMPEHTIVDLDDPHSPGIQINLTPGNVLAVYSDTGPGGPCGQSMRATSPHMVLHHFPNEDAFREWASQKIGRNQKHDLRIAVVGEWSSPGPISVVTHGNDNA